MKDSKQEKKQPKLNLRKISEQPESLANGNKQREACKVCMRYAGVREVVEAFTYPDVPQEWTRRLLVVDGVHSGSKILRFLRKQWRKAGWKDVDVATVNSVRCDNGRSPTMGQIRACRPFLLRVVAELKPDNIIALGATALRTIRNNGDGNITKNRGKAITL